MSDVVKFLLLLVGIAGIFVVWEVAEPATQAVLGPVPMFNPAVEGLESFFSLVWLGLRLFFWLLVGLVGTTVVLFALASVGVVTWVVQQLCRGFVYVSGVIKGMFETPEPKMETEIATDPSGDRVTVRQVLENHESRLAAIEARNVTV